MTPTAARPSPHVTRVTYEPRGAARALFLCRDPEILISGPAGTGKSRSALEKLHLCLSKYAGAKALISRKTKMSLTASGLETFRDHVLHPLDGVRFFGGNNEEPPQYRYPNGSRIMVGGLDNPAKTLSTEYDLVYLQEALEATLEDWELLTRSLRNGVMPFQQIIGDANPGPPNHWIKQRADSGVTTHLESRHEDNPRYWAHGNWTPEGEVYIGRLDRLSGVRKLRLRHGRWAAAEGLVYETFDSALHVIDPFPVPETWRRIATVDWGWTNPGVIQVWAIDGDGRMYRIHELYQTHQRIGWWVVEAKALATNLRVERFICDPSEPGFIADFQAAGLKAEPAMNAIRPGIQQVEERLSTAGDGRARLYLFRGALTQRDEALEEAKKPLCTEQEFDSYVWPKGQDGKPLKEIPVDENNHGLDCTRYAAMHLATKRRTTGQRTAVSEPRPEVASYRPR